jgi:hypothetical protein
MDPRAQHIEDAQRLETALAELRDAYRIAAKKVVVAWDAAMQLGPRTLPGITWLADEYGNEAESRVVQAEQARARAQAHKESL